MMDSIQQTNASRSTAWGDRWCCSAKRLAAVVGFVAASVGHAGALSAQELSTKRGWAGGGNIPGEVNPSNADWYYSWWHDKPAGDANANADWIPLIKFVNGNFQNNLNIVAGYNDVDTILVLNEPEREDQSDVDVQTALSVWPQVQQTLPHLKLVSPGVSDTPDGRDWLDAFFQEVETRNSNADSSDDLRVDAVAFHWYGAADGNNPVAAANNFLNRVDWYHTQYNRPVWITEFAIHDWDNNESDEQILEANRIFLETVIPELESRSYVEKYAYYSYFDDAVAFTGGTPTPTGPGDAYVGTLQAGESYDLDGVDHGTNVFYFRGGQLVNEGASLASAARALDAIEGANTIGGASDWGLSGDSFVRVRDGATLTKTGASTVNWTGADADVAGVLSVAQGTIYMDGGSLSGTGTTVVEAGATLEFRPPGGRGSYQIAGHAVELAGTLSGNLLISQGATITATQSSALVSGPVTFSGGTIDVGGAGFTEVNLIGSPVIAGLQLNFDAALDTPGDTIWTNSVDTADSLAFASSATPVSASDPTFAALSEAYEFTAAGGATGLIGYFETAGPRSVADATFEVVFRVDDSSTAADQVILEAGGAGRGVAFVLNGSQLKFNVDGNGSDIDLLHTLTPGWHQAIGVIDLDAGGDSVTLYVNGNEVGSLNGQNIGDWAGGNPLGLGQGADSATGVVSSPGQAFDGQIAIARYYANTAFTLADVQQNFQALAGEPIATEMRFDSDISLAGDSLIRLDIAAGGLADKVVVDGRLTLLDAELVVSQFGEAPLAAGELFNLFDATQFSGGFETITLPPLDAGLMWNLGALETAGEISITLAGDYNGDGAVDTADYSVWRDSLGMQVTPSTGADGDGDGDIDADDYVVWRSAFGAQVGSGGPQGAGVVVPEPAAVLLLLIAPALLAPRSLRCASVVARIVA